MTNSNPKQTLSHGTQPLYHVIVIEDPLSRKTIYLKNSTYSVGRDSTNSIIITGKRVSRYHATLIKRADLKNNDYSFWIIDGNLDGERSTNGVFVNKEKCLVQELKTGDIIELGEVVINYYIVNDYSKINELKSKDFKQVTPERDIKLKSSSTEIDSGHLGKHLIISEPSFEEQNKHNDSQVKEQHKLQQTLYQTLFIQSNQGIFLVDAVTNNIIQANEAFCEILGYSLEEIIKLNLNDILVININILEEAFKINNDKQIKRRDQFLKKSGDIIYLEQNINLINTEGKNYFSFIINETNNLSNNLNKSTTPESNYYDTLTNLPNETIFLEYVMNNIANAKRYKYPMAVMLLNVQYSEYINVQTPINLPERLRKKLAEELKKCLRSGDVLGRWKNGDFAILLPRLSNPKDAARVSQRILNVFKQPLVIENTEIPINRVSIGIGVYPQDGQSAASLLSSAAQVLERRKKNNIQGYEFHQVTLNNETARAIRLEHLLKEAVKKKQFTVYYQPIVNIKTGKLTGVESLLRWNHPQMGIIAPKQFISVAEESDLIILLDQWMLQTACFQNKAWQKMGFPSLPVSVNISHRQFHHPKFISYIQDLLQKTGLSPNWLSLELTEKTISENIDLATEHIHELRKLGVQLCMDDFGIGTSAVGHLQKFPFHTLKLNQSFVRHLGDTSADLAIISAANSLARGFNMKLIAEGVESLQQLQILKKYECEQIQGNLFSPPLPVQEATKMLACGNYTFSGTFFRDKP